MLRDEYERKIGFGLAVRKLAGHDDVPVILRTSFIREETNCRMSFWDPLREEEDTAAQAASSEGSCPRMLRPLPHRVRSPLFFSVQSRQGKQQGQPERSV